MVALRGHPFLFLKKGALKKKLPENQWYYPAEN